MTNNRYKILVIEDEENLAAVLSTLLEGAGYQPIRADTCALALTLYASHRPDLALLDLGLPDADGMRFLREVRRENRTPVIVLSARSNERDKVEALDAGANDYVTKPFSSAELLARIRSALRTFGPQEGRKPGTKFVLGDLRIDYEARRVCIRSQDVRLTQTEYNIVAFLSEHCGKMMTYSAIAKGVWGYFDEGCVKRLQVNMANIRRKFGVRLGENRYIANELGVGYRMNGERDE